MPLAVKQREAPAPAEEALRLAHSDVQGAFANVRWRGTEPEAESRVSQACSRPVGKAGAQNELRLARKVLRNSKKSFVQGSPKQEEE